MPFSFLDIERRKSRSIIFLFFTLFSFYFISAFLIYSAVRFDFMIGIVSGSSKPYSISTLFKIFTVALLVALIHWIFSTRNMIPRLLSVIGAKPIDPEDRYHLLLKNIVDEVSVATGGMRIEPYVVYSRYFNAFALSDLKGRAVIGITEGLLTKMNRRQMEAVVAHETSHLVWGDCMLTTISCSIAAVYAGLVKIFTSGWQGGSGALYRRRGGFPIGITFLILVVYIMRFLTLILNTWISREREFRADASAVRLTRDPLSLAEALYLISKEWRGNSLPVEELSQIFIVSPHRKRLEESWGFLANLFTTHPPVRKRIDILLDMGHTDYGTLKSSVKEKFRKQEEIPVSSPENNRIWYAQNEKTWHGPFSLFELAQLKWLDPFTWITTEHDKRVKPAHEYIEINKLLKRGLPTNLNIQTCLVCNQGLERVYYEGVPIWRCNGCKGRLVKQAHLQRIIVREEMGFSPHIKEMVKQIKLSSLRHKGKYVKEPTSTLKCPCCGNMMKRTFYRAIMPYRLEIDICRVCDLFWFDQNELEVIQYLTEGRV